MINEIKDDLNAHIKIIKKDDDCEITISGNSITLSALLFTAMINTPDFNFIVIDALDSYASYKAQLN